MLYKPQLGLISAGGFRNHSRYLGCVGHWMMGEGGGLTAHDVSGYRRDGTLTSGQAWSIGKFGPTALFDGIDDKIVLSSGSILDTLSQISVSAWIFKTSAVETQNAIVNKSYYFSADAALEGWTFCLESYELYSQLGFGVAFASGEVFKLVNTSLTLNAWVHVVATWDGGLNSSGIKLYVDGRESGYGISGNGTGARVSDSAYTLAIGEIDNDDGAPFTGKIDDVRIYNRILTSKEVASLYTDPFLEFEPRQKKVRAAAAAGGSIVPILMRQYRQRWG